LIRGFVLNKFRGDPRLLAPGPETLARLTGIPTVAVLPMWREHGLPEEDGVYDARPSGSGLSVAVLAYPYISNLDEFTPLRNVPGLSLSWAREAQTVASADLLVLPGSKHVAADLEWIRRRGLDAAIAAHIAGDKPTLAICGGLQMLGTRLDDPHGVEGDAVGLGLMPYRTEFLPAKTYRNGRYSLSELRGFWEPLSRLGFDGYEIHHGVTEPSAGHRGLPTMQPALSANGGWQRGQLLALYPHGLLENPRVIKALFGAEARTLDDVMEGLADFIDGRFVRDTLMSYADGRPNGASRQVHDAN
jgi:adenosylcobyric acid synthase